jgi:hypothetical protein
MELASCHPSGARNFQVAPRFLENSWTADIHKGISGGLEQLDFPTKILHAVFVSSVHDK